MSLIDTTAVVKRFGDNTAVDRVTFHVEPGEVVGLLGANGAGKSTLIRLILGLIAPNAGRVTLLGEVPSRAGRARLGYVPQSLGLYPDLSIDENLAFVAEAFGVAAPQLSADLESVRHQPVGELSLGVRRRVAFAAATSHGPELLLLDEPTSGVGPLGRADLWTSIGAAAAAGVGVLVSTHYMEEAEQCDRVVMLTAGRAVATGTVADIEAMVEAVEVTAPNWHPVYELLDKAGLRPAIQGERLRVGGTDPATISRLLQAAGLDAEAHAVPAQFEEAFVALASA